MLGGINIEVQQYFRVIVSPKVIFAKEEQSWAILGWEEDFCGGDVLNVSQRGDGYSPRTSGVD